jgi:recombination protein RecA
MSADKKLMEKLFKLHGGTPKRNVHSEAIETHSPSLNFIFGNGWGLPRGYSLLLYGQPKGGKSLISRSMIGQLHKNDPEAVAVVFDTEMRWTGQVLNDPNQLKAYDIDENRIRVFETNHPAEIFDCIEKELSALIQAGLKISLVIIDSLTGIMGRRAGTQDTIMTQQRGDHALTIQEGLKQILNTIRKHNIGLVLTTQVRDEQDPAEIMKRKKIKPAVGWASKHFCEYSMYVEPIDSQAGRQTLSGDKLEDLSLSVFKPSKEGERIGHRIRARMAGSTMGPKNRVAEFTINYKQGFVNQHEEVFELGVGSGAIEKPTTMSYSFGDRKWTGAKNMMQALKDEPDLCANVLQEVKRRDLEGSFKGIVDGDSETGDNAENLDDEIE